MKEDSAIDFLDAYMQLVLAMTWQHRRSDGLMRLKELAESVEQRLEGWAPLFEDPRALHVAKSQVLLSLQRIRNRGQADILWTMNPHGVDLQAVSPELFCRLSSEIHAAAVTTTEHLQHHSLDAKVDILSRATRALSTEISFPLFAPEYVVLILNLSKEPELRRSALASQKLKDYLRKAEKIAKDTVRTAIAVTSSELAEQAIGIDLEIDQSFDWDTLASYSETPLTFLRQYAMFNELGYVSDARFLFKRSKKPSLYLDELRRLWTPSMLWATGLMMQGRDAEDRRLAKLIQNPKGPLVNPLTRDPARADAFTVTVPQDIKDEELEQVIAKLLFRLFKRRRGASNSAPGSLPDHRSEFSGALRSIMERQGVKRRLFSGKKQILLCACGLIAEEIYRRRLHLSGKSIVGGTEITTREDADEYVSLLIHDVGFSYSAETLRRNRSRFRKDFLESVPGIFGLKVRPRPIRG
ncbi:hypothetical protein [Paracidovorax avenae]|uniref:hypothetical protein n=1 Tax=Paracidovorax avenae TaxID=80867 RepID=UPI001AD84755|nr:hypothetical protein [Paracidovorax avenae]